MNPGINFEKKAKFFNKFQKTFNKAIWNKQKLLISLHQWELIKDISFIMIGSEFSEEINELTAKNLEYQEVIKQQQIKIEQQKLKIEQ